MKTAILKLIEELSPDSPFYPVRQKLMGLTAAQVGVKTANGPGNPKLLAGSLNSRLKATILPKGIESAGLPETIDRLKNFSGDIRVSQIETHRECFYCITDPEIKKIIGFYYHEKIKGIE